MTIFTRKALRHVMFYDTAAGTMTYAVPSTGYIIRVALHWAWSAPTASGSQCAIQLKVGGPGVTTGAGFETPILAQIALLHQAAEADRTHEDSIIIPHQMRVQAKQVITLASSISAGGLSISGHVWIEEDQ